MTITSSSVIKKLLILFLVIAGLYYAKVFLMPLAIGAVMAALFLPLCKGLESKKFPKGLAALTCLLVIVAIITGIAFILGWQISELSNDVALIKQKANETITRLQEFIFKHLGISIKKQEEMLNEEKSSVADIIPIIASMFTYILTCFILMMVYIFLLLYYRQHIKDFFLKLFEPAQRKEMEQVIYSATNVSQQYLMGLAKMIGCLWIMYSIGFTIAGVKNSFVFAILCGMLEIVPFIGNITGTAITLLVSIAQGASLSMLAGIVITYGIVQFIQGWVLEPIIVGPQVKINPFATILALVLGELVWGIPGIILAIPLTAMFKIVCDHVEPLKPYGFLIGEIDTGKKESPFRKKISNWFKRKPGKRRK